MKWLYQGLVLFIIVMAALALAGCVTTKAANTTSPSVVRPTPVVTTKAVNTTAIITPVPVPTKPNLTADDKEFLKKTIDQESVSISMIANTLTQIQGGHYDSARALAESVEKNLKLQYSNLSAQPVSPFVQPVKDEILEAVRDEINGSHKLKYIAISESEGMTGASKDYRDSADELFRMANIHLNSAQSKINALGR